MPSEKAVKSDSILRRIFKRYFVDAMGAMALGLFSSLIIGLIISQLSQIGPLAFLQPVTEVLSAKSPVIGAAIGVAVAYGLKADPLVIFSAASCGAIGYAAGDGAGGPVGAFIAALVGVELGQLISKKTPVDIIVAGCCAQMVGFAVVSFRENGVGGLLSQGLGTSMLQIPNIMRRPQIWIAPTVASGLCGAVSAALLGMTNNAAGAGMGTSGLVGQFGAIASMGASPKTFLLIGLAHFLLPAAAALAVHLLLRRVGWVREGDMKLEV